MMKKALLLNTGHNDLGLIRALRKLGYSIVATGNQVHTPGEKWVDRKIQADYSDKDGILRIAREEKIDCICACCNDFGVYTAAYVAEKLGLPGYDSYETTLTLHNKDRFKKFALENRITSPVSRWFSSPGEALRETEGMQYPLIVKPVDCSAGNGVSVVHSNRTVLDAVTLAFAKSRSGRIVIEPFLKGTQHGFCTYLLNRKVVAFCSNDEFSFMNPFRVEIDTFPASNWRECSGQLISEIEKIAETLQLKDGIFHLQYIYADGKPWIIEVMRRTIGNMYHVPGNQLNGIQWEYWEARARCGLECADFPRPVRQEGFYAYKTILAQANGTIADVKIPPQLEKHMFGRFMLKSPGDCVQNHLSEPVGFLFTMFSSEQEMKNMLIDNYQSDYVKMDGTSFQTIARGA